MASPAAILNIVVHADASKAASSLRDIDDRFGRAGSSSEKFRSHLASVAKTAAFVAGGAALGGIAATLKIGYGEWKDHAKIAAQTGAVLKSTGGVANVTAKQIDSLAGSLLRKSGVDDEAIQSGENMLLTFKNIRNEAGKGNDIFNQTTSTLLDMTTALTHGHVTAEALSKQAIQLGKAMNDPVKGMTALRRVGVTFTEDQTKQVAAMVKTGNTMGAQKLVLKELNSEFGGSAEAMGKTLPGQISILKESFNNLAGNIFAKLVPTLQTVVTWTTEHWPQISQVFNTVFGAVGVAIRAVAPIIGQFIEWSRQAVEYIQAHWTQISVVVSQVMGSVKSVITDTVTVVKAIWAQFGDAILAVLHRTFDAIGSVIRNAFNVVVGVFQLFGDILHGRWGEVWDDLKKIVTNAFSAIVTIIRTSIANAATIALALGKAVVQGVLRGLEALGAGVLHALAGLGSVLVSTAASALGAAIAIGRAIIAGIVDGLGNVFDRVFHALADPLVNAFNSVKAKFKIGSPSQLMADEIGKPLAEGVILGWVTGSAALPSKMAESTKNAIEAARKVISSSKSSFESAFSDLSSTANTLFSGITSAATTAAGRKLAALMAAHDAAGIKQAVSDAQAQLAQAQAGGDQATILAAQAQLNEALYQQQIAALQKQAAAEQLQLDASNAVKQTAFDKALEKLQKHLANGKTSTASAMDQIEKLLRKYGVTFGEVGADMGRAWVRGLKNAIEDAAKGAGSLKNAINDAASKIHVGGHALGTAGASRGLALVGEHGPELMNFRGGESVLSAGRTASLGGGVNVYVTVQPGFIGDEEHLADRLVAHINRGIARQGHVFRPQTN